MTAAGDFAKVTIMHKPPPAADGAAAAAAPRSRRRPTLRQFIARRRHAAAPTPIRVRRLLDADVVVGAYGVGALSACPVEIVDLSDGTRVCEWSETATAVVRPRPSILDGDHELAALFEESFGPGLVRSRSRSGAVEVPLRVRFASEADMWRGLHARAAAKSDARRYVHGISDPTVGAWVPMHRRHEGAAIVSVEAACATTKRSLAAEARAERRALKVAEAAAKTSCRAQPSAVGDFVAADEGASARDAYGERTSALAATVLAWSPVDGELRAVVVPVSGEADDRALDSLGRRNGGHRKGGRAGSQGAVGRSSVGGAKSARA